MLHRITGRAGKCGPCAISAIAGVPTLAANCWTFTAGGERFG